MLTHKVTKRVDLPNEPDGWIEVRMPSLAILDKAREARSRKAIQLVQGMDLAQLKGLTTERQEQETGADYDWQTLLQECVTAWSYAEPVTAENVAELDEPSVAAVLAVLLPRETEADRKNA